MIGRDGYIFSAKYYNRRIDPPKANIFVKEGIMTIRLQNQQIQVNQIYSTSYILFLHHIYQFINAKPQFVGISIPSYYSVEQIIRVISIYGFLPPANMLILPEYVSNVLNFCFCNSIRNDSEERNIVIVDVGYTYGSSTLFRVNKDSCEILSHNYTRNIGGEEIDKLIMNYIKNYLKEECNINSISPRNEVNILHKMIEAKEKLSAEGANKIVVTFENLYEDNDDDISIDFTVQELNEIIKDIAQNLNKIFESSLFQKLNNNEMQNLEICVVGGTMRIPFLQNTLKMFMKDIYNNNRNINYTINMDENVAYGNICFIFQHLKYWNFTFKDSSGSKINENIGNAVDKRERCDLIFQSASELINQLNNYNEISSERNNLEGKIYKVEHLAENNERKKIILDKLQPFQEFYEKNSNNKTKLQKQNKRIDNLIDRINLNRSLSLTPESADESSYSSVTSSSSSTLSSSTSASTTTLSVSTATEATKPRRKSNTSNNDNHNNPINTLSAAKYDKIEDVVKSKAPSPQSASTIHNIMKEESPKSNHSDKSKQLEKSSSLSSSIENLMSEDDDQLLSRQEQQQQYQEEEEEQQQQHEQQEQVSFSKPLPPAASLKDEMYNKIEDVIKNDSIIIPSGSISEDSFINSNTNSPLLNPSPIKFPSNLSTSVSSSAVNSNNYNNNDSYEMNNNSDENPEEKVEIENTPFVTKRKDLLSSQKSDSKPYNDGDNTTLSELNEQLTFTDNNNNNNTTTTTQSTLSLVKDKLSGVRSNSSSSFSSNSFVSPITPPPVQQQQQSVIKSSGILPPPPPLEPLQKNELSSQQQQQQSEIKSIPSSSRSSSESSVGNETTLNNIHHNLQSPMGIKEDNNNIQQLPPQLQEQNKIHSTNTLLLNDTNNTTNKSLTFITTNLDSNSELPPLKSPQKSPQHSFGSFQPQPQPLIQPKPKPILLQKQILPHQYLPPLAPPKKTLETITTQTTPPELPKVKEYSVIDMVIDKNLYSESCYKLEVNSEMNTFDTVPLIYRTVFTVQPILNYKSMNQL